MFVCHGGKSRRMGAAASAAVFLCLSLIASCSSSSSGGVGSDGAKVSAPPPPPRFPLTAEVAPAGANLGRRAMAIKIENTPEARPQKGLDTADIVFEEVVEYGITRYLAVYQSKLPGETGPIRSGRPVDPDILLQFGQPAMAFSGAIPAVEKSIRDAGIQTITDQKGGPFYRRRGKSAPHNLYADGSKLYEEVGPKTPGPPPAAIVGEAIPPIEEVSGTPTTAVDIPFSDMEDARWAWDATAKRWVRSEGSKPATLEGGARISTANLLILSVEILQTPYADVNNYPVPSWKVVGSGPCLALFDARAVKCRWIRDSKGAPTSLVDERGRTFRMGPGQTWVELLPSDRFEMVSTG